MCIPGTLEEWRVWTGLPFDTTGPVVVPGALAPVMCDAEHGVATYVEPNVWIRHATADREGGQAPATALRTSLTQSARNASAHSAISTLEWILLRHSTGVRSVLSSHSSVIARNGMKNAPSTP